VVVFRTASGYRATARACPHQYADLLAGRIVDDGTAVRCPVHGFVFKLADGEGVNCPGFQLRIYDVIERDGALLARAVDTASG
jgi:nitrite reductase/ring-hydroxylating ferredoxin subunit